MLEIYVFDDVDFEFMVYLGLVKVLLIILVNDKLVKGMFEFRKVSYFLLFYDFICRWIGF